MNLFLQSFDDGEILQLADELGRRGQLIQDIRHKFSQQYACLWSKETGEELLRELCTEYRAVRATNQVLNAQLHLEGKNRLAQSAQVVGAVSNAGACLCGSG